MVIVFAKFGFGDIATTQRPVMDFTSLHNITGCTSLSLGPVENMENSYITEIEDIDQSHTAANEKCVNKLLTSNTLKQCFNVTFSEIMTTTT